MSSVESVPLSKGDAVFAAFGQGISDIHVKLGLLRGISDKTSYKTYEQGVSRFNDFFDLDRARITLEAKGINFDRFLHLLQLPNSPSFFLSALANRPKEIVTQLAKTLGEYQDNDMLDNLTASAWYIASANTNFYANALLATGLEAALGTEEFDQCIRDEITLDDKNKDSIVREIIHVTQISYKNQGEKRLNTVAENAEEIFDRLQLAYPSDPKTDGVYQHYINTLEGIAFGKRKETPQSGCPMRGFVGRVFREFGIILPQLRDVFAEYITK